MLDSRCTVQCAACYTRGAHFVLVSERKPETLFEVSERKPETFFIFGAQTVHVSSYLLASFFDALWRALGGILGAVLVDYWSSCLILFLTLGKMANPS